MSISTFNFQFYNYKMPAAMGCSTSRSSSSFISELEMDIDEEMSSPSVTSTPKPRFTTELALQLQHDSSTPPAVPAKTTLPCLRPQLHTAQKRWSMELREKVLEMSKRNNGSDGEDQPQTTEQEHPLLQLQEKAEQQNVDVDVNVNVDVNPIVTPTVTDKINFFNKLTNTFESTRSGATGTANGISSKCNNNNNRFISLLRSTRPQGIATTSSSNNSSLSGISVLSQVPPPKPKRLMATASPSTTFAMPSSMGMSSQRKCSLRRKPSMDKSRATISRQNSSASVRPQHHAIMEDLSLVVPVRLRIAEYEQRISMSA
ncbi:protein bottleneck [Drosophila subobscura]|uniref:protein bottleneck n=1 Tax=Drosophila subobscura TaxID=7241 RepID=UPI00155A42DF|nr:protein bottleneck [Drosophila subobscura]